MSVREIGLGAAPLEGDLRHSRATEAGEGTAPPVGIARAFLLTGPCQRGLKRAGALTLRAEMIARKGQDVRTPRLFRCLPRAASGAALVLLLCLSAPAGCGSPEEARVQRVAYCQGPSSDTPDGDSVNVEFRQGSTVVARATVSVGIVLTVEVPVGDIQIYVDDSQVGEVNEGTSADGPYSSPAPDEVTYIASAEGCPATANR
jgi:hypothetical protein